MCKVQLRVVGPLTTSGVVPFIEGVELLWIKFKLGTFMPHMPAVSIRDVETTLPGANRRSFWLNGSAWQFPDYENADTFVERLAHEEILAFDPVVSTVLQGESHGLAPRTVRHRFLQATGMTQNQTYQVQRAQEAAPMLRQGAAILDVVERGLFRSAAPHAVGEAMGRVYARADCRDESPGLPFCTRQSL